MDIFALVFHFASSISLPNSACGDVAITVFSEFAAVGFASFVIPGSLRSSRVSTLN